MNNLLIKNLPSHERKEKMVYYARQRLLRISDKNDDTDLQETIFNLSKKCYNKCINYERLGCEQNGNNGLFLILEIKPMKYPSTVVIPVSQFLSQKRVWGTW